MEFAAIFIQVYIGFWMNHWSWIVVGILSAIALALIVNAIYLETRFRIERRRYRPAKR